MELRQFQLQDKVYNKMSFYTASTKEELCSNYFALEGDNLYDCEIIPFLQKMKNNHTKCPYWILLKHHCPCSIDRAIKRKNKKTFPKPSQQTLLDDYSTVENVHSFVCSVLKRIIPLELFGHKNNRKMFFKNIQGILRVQKHGEISLDYLLREIKVSKMPWLSPYNHKEQRERLLNCVDFLVTKVICPLIKSFFISVFSSNAKINLFMFRKRVWHRLIHKAFHDYNKFCKLDVIAKHRVHDMLVNEECLGCVKINFVLKKNSLRPISNLSFRWRGKPSINCRLTSLLAVLNYERDTNKEMFGIVSMKMSDLYQNLKEYKTKIQKGGCQQLYFATADVEKCFDSIHQALMFNISLNLLRSDFYAVKKYRIKTHGQTQRARYFESVHNIKYIQCKYGDVEQVGQRMVSKESMVKNLEALLLNNVVKMGKNYFLQRKGISQGSKISSLLCAAYLSHIENKINITKGSDEFLTRTEDEYLFISTRKDSAEKFLRQLIKNMPTFDIYVNIKKCAANFDCDLGLGIGKLEKSLSVRFYGLLFHPESFCVSSDYSHYKGLKATDVVTCQLTRHPGLKLKKSIVNSLYPKCSAILFDMSINSDIVIEKNVLAIFCMTAIKFHFLVLSLPWRNRVDKNPSFFLDIILRLPALLHQRIIQLLNEADPMEGNNSPSPLSIETICGLCYNAFLCKLLKHRDIYHKIIGDLEDQVLRYPKYSKFFMEEAFYSVYLT